MRNRLTSLGAAIAALVLVLAAPASAQLPGGTLGPTAIPKYVQPLAVPPAMPKTAVILQKANPRAPGRAPVAIDYYEIAVRQFDQQILPPADVNGAPLPPTAVWSYGSVNHPGTFNYPAFTVEAQYGRPVRVKWVNDLRDAQGNYLPHLLPVDPTLHWANPPGGEEERDSHPMFEATPGPYTGPVPISVHLHGGHSQDWADGFPESWFLPAAANIPSGYATVGSHYEAFRAAAEAALGCPADPLACWGPGFAVFQYDNLQDATTLWYHDHTLGMTRTNVYAGPAGFYLLRGGPADEVKGKLPGPAPSPDERAGTRHYEIPIVIQDRSFNSDGSLFYPPSREFFDGFAGPYLPEPLGGERRSDISPIWNPEFFGNTMVVNGRTWPFLEVEARRYRFRFLNGCDSRFLLLATNVAGAPAAVPFWHIGSDGGFLPAPIHQDTVLLGPAERADVIMDFSDVAPGTRITLLNLGPDEPFGGGVPGTDFAVSDPGTTGQVMEFRVVKRERGDTSARPEKLAFPARRGLPSPTNVRKVSLNELGSATLCVDASGAVVDCDDSSAVDGFGPREAELGTVDTDGSGVPLQWAAPVTENPAVGATEVWEIHNFTEDAHPIHIHEIMFEVVNREAMDSGAPRRPERWE
ncbi:MAG TPA: multicopper oxidase domain-containing protein, partial [Anaeromyxobacteraceae bacterium]|nr:multicopper oxidase domain-containing protein [Anaeromyxobacteraceae bacterium]